MFLLLTTSQLVWSKSLNREWVSLPQGLGVTIERPGGGAGVARIVDEKTQSATRFHYDPRTRSSAITQFAHGKIVETFQRRRGEIEITRYGKRTLREVQTFSALGSGIVERFERTKTGDWKKLSSRSFGPEAFMLCNEAASLAELGTRVSGFITDHQDIVSFLHRDESGDSVFLGHNLRSQNCEALRPDGNDQLVGDVTDALNQGLSCLQNLGSAAIASSDATLQARGQRLQQMARTVLGHFIEGANAPFTIRCQRPIPRYPDPGWEEARRLEPGNMIGASKHAFAATCDQPEVLLESTKDMTPGIQLNTEYFSTVEPNRRGSTIFHELLHHTGMFHEEAGTHDLVYGLTFCCFGLDSDSRRPALDALATNFLCHRALSQDHGATETSAEATSRVEELLR
jgi:hypothetical protein